MKHYPLAYNPILEYWGEIESGKIVVSRKVYKTFEYLAEQLASPSGQYYYSPRRANHILEFAEAFCRNSKGKYGGKLVKLELWEKAILAAIFGFVDAAGLRQYRTAILIVGKKNGKSLLASVVGNYMLTADGEAGPEVYAVATKRDQAKIIWSEAKRMVQKSPTLKSRVKPLVGELQCPGNDGVFKPLSSDSGTLDGLNVHCALMDEVHQWKSGRELYDIVADGIAAREQPLIFVTSTAGTIREDIYDELYEEAERVINGYTDPEGYHDERFIAFVYELDSRAEWTDPSCWKKANPGLGTIKNAQTLAEKVEKAKANPALVKNLACKEFCIRETSAGAWLTFEELDNRDTFSLLPSEHRFVWTHDGVDRELPYPRYGCAGADLSSTTDLTAAKMIFSVPGCDKIFVLSMYWIPENTLESHIREDHIPYDKWYERGLVRLCAGSKVNYKDVTAWFSELQNELGIYLFTCGYDAWSAGYWVDDMAAEFGEGQMLAVRQGKKTLSQPMQLLGAALAEKQIVYNNNPIDKWCFANTTADEDINGNIQPRKSNRPTRRIDGMAALLDAYIALLENQEDYYTMIGGMQLEPVQ